jgi:hypothetical protein
MAVPVFQPGWHRTSSKEIRRPLSRSKSARKDRPLKFAAANHPRPGKNAILTWLNPEIGKCESQGEALGK